MQLPPSQSDLQAMGGWALTQTVNAPPAKALAMRKLHEGCRDASEHVDGAGRLVAESTESKTKEPQAETSGEVQSVRMGMGHEQKPPQPRVPGVRRSLSPGEMTFLTTGPAAGAASEKTGGCSHDFSLTAPHRCARCRKTFEDVHGHKPELMEA